MVDFSFLFHTKSKNHSLGRSSIPLNADEWPKEWETTYYKSYPRLPKVKLGKVPPKADFFDLVKQRKSRRDFGRRPITKREISILLGYSCGNMKQTENGHYHRAQPSAGARFPIEVYPLVFRSGKDLEAGLYHYNVKKHALDVLWKHEFADKDIDALFAYPWVKNAAVAFIMTSVFWRTQNKYGARGYRYILLEAGHIGQNIYLATEALGLKCCALVGTRDETIEKLIDIDGTTESIVYALAAGK